MIKVVNGKTYNTGTAIKLATWKNEGDFTIYTHSEETLYETTRNGNMFLFCQGGFLSQHAKYREYNKTKACQKIVPLEIEEAVRWAAKKLSADEFWAIFCPESALGL